ncbi:MAG TPA: hypothetical protein VKY27_10810, partial [Bacteriovoracaceae bacterium]|nr:hypothetical protein [Bacteriovoracaceae bacterium]
VQSTFNKRVWNETLMNVAFWGLNLGLALMIVLSLLPIGLIQFKAALEVGLWYARGSEVMQTDLIQNLRWLRSIGDIVFAIGALSFAAAIIDRVGLYKFNKVKTVEVENDEVASV